jgi:hypothetical protein
MVDVIESFNFPISISVSNTSNGGFTGMRIREVYIVPSLVIFIWDFG